jgi:hypothetical protein
MTAPLPDLVVALRQRGVTLQPAPDRPDLVLVKAPAGVLHDADWVEIGERKAELLAWLEQEQRSSAARPAHAALVRAALDQAHATGHSPMPSRLVAEAEAAAWPRLTLLDGRTVGGDRAGWRSWLKRPLGSPATSLRERVMVQVALQEHARASAIEGGAVE